MGVVEWCTRSHLPSERCRVFYDFGTPEIGTVYESDAQDAVSTPIIDGDVDELSVAITDDELAVIVDIGDKDAAYTADEARELAKSLKCVSDQRWEGDNDVVVEYIRDLADVVDNDATVKEVREKWNDQRLDLTI